MRIPYRVNKISNRIIRYIFAYLNTGDRVFCHLCGWKGRSFFKERCPVCYSKPRNRLLVYSFGYFNLNLDSEIFLHVGPNKLETEWTLNKFNPQLFIHFDIRKNPFVNLMGDLTRLPLADESIGLILAWHVFEHIEKDYDAIQEAFRVLKKGGVMIISVPIHPPRNQKTYEAYPLPTDKYKEIFGQSDHVRACGLDYWKRFEGSGFLVKALKISDIKESLLEPDIRRYGLSLSHIVWHCQKV